MKKCGKSLQCGVHQCKNYCYECFQNGCPPCKIVAEKTLDCGHVIKAPCQAQFICLEPCAKTLDCGHQCPLKCHESCLDAICNGEQLSFTFVLV